jgi:hypothetical protein
VNVLVLISSQSHDALDRGSHAAVTVLFWPVWHELDEIISTDFYHSTFKTEVRTRCFPTQCYVDCVKVNYTF